MNYTEEYKNKLSTAEEAVMLVKSGDWVDYGHFACSPTYLDPVLAKRVKELRDVKVRAVCYPGLAAVAMADPSRRSFTYNNWHFSGGDRMLHDRGLCNYIPLNYHEGADYYRHLRADVFMVKAAPMDRFGYFNFGPSNSITRAIAESASIVIVEVNTNVPYCHGGHNEGIHISDVHCIVESDNAPLISVPAAAVSEADRRIAERIIAQIEDGSCIQLGIGGMPNAVGMMIADSGLKDLGVHTEMLVDAYVDMYESGCVTNRRKSIDPGKIVYTFALGSRRLYDFLDRNPSCASYSADYTNDPVRIAFNDKVVSINNAVEVDLYGQVASESSGTRQISGTGGQFDFAFGAFHSKGGKSFLCLSSTKQDKQGNILSRIRPTLAPGTIVTVPRTIAQYIVTEYGIAMLKGKSTWERCEALIEIAHPSFHEDLIREAGVMGIWTKGHKEDALVA
ncbi:MAG: 4-hydroxybutyrate CoA-transferase [Spirochaetes bacterium]|nr:MAG: 4-hydroxybutyrate CoA-transferase [Spirochaetota bacterium]